MRLGWFQKSDVFMTCGLWLYKCSKLNEMARVVHQGVLSPSRVELNTKLSAPII